MQNYGLGSGIKTVPGRGPQVAPSNLPSSVGVSGGGGGGRLANALRRQQAQGGISPAAMAALAQASQGLLGDGEMGEFITPALLGGGDNIGDAFGGLLSPESFNFQGLTSAFDGSLFPMGANIDPLDMFKTAGNGANALTKGMTAGAGALMPDWDSLTGIFGG